MSRPSSIVDDEDSQDKPFSAAESDADHNFKELQESELSASEVDTVTSIR